MVISKDNDRLVAIVSKDVKSSLMKMAKAENRSLSNYVAYILENYVRENKK